jgi:hypothetical protein
MARLKGKVETVAADDDGRDWHGEHETRINSSGGAGT